MKQHKVGVVVLNYNGWMHTIECLESVLKLTHNSFQVIVVDNKSTDDSVEKMIEWADGKIEIEKFSSEYNKLLYPLVKKPILYDILSIDELKKAPKDQNLKFIINSNNNGYASGNNIGIIYLLKDPEITHIWILNNDTVVDPNALSASLITMGPLNKRIGIVGSKLLFYDAPKIIQNIGASFNKWLATTREIGANEVDTGQYNNDRPVELVQGASMLVSREYIDEVGLMAEEYFLFFEEVDWTIRGRMKNWICFYSAKSMVYHKAGATTGATSDKLKRSHMSDYYYFKNKIVLTKKFFPVGLLTVYFSFAIAAVNRFKRKQYDRIPMILKIIAST